MADPGDFRRYSYFSYARPGYRIMIGLLLEHVFLLTEPGGSGLTGTYNRASRPQWTRPTAGRETWGYDAAGRFTSASYPDGSTEADQYDAAGNRTVITSTTTLSGAVQSIDTEIDSCWCLHGMIKIASSYHRAGGVSDRVSHPHCLQARGMDMGAALLVRW